MPALRAVAEDCGWSPKEFATFYEDGVRKELAALRAAIEVKDGTEITRLAHGARGSSAAACIPAMAAAFRSLEEAEPKDAAARLDDAEALLERVLERLAALCDGSDQPGC